MAAKPHLRAVDADERAAPPPADLKEAVERSERELLIAIRHTIAAQVDAGVPAHALGSLMKQLREADRDVRALDLMSKQEAERAGDVPDEQFDASAI